MVGRANSVSVGAGNSAVVFNDCGPLLEFAVEHIMDRTGGCIVCRCDDATFGRFRLREIRPCYICYNCYIVPNYLSCYGIFCSN